MDAFVERCKTTKPTPAEPQTPRENGSGLRRSARIFGASRKSPPLVTLNTPCPETLSGTDADRPIRIQMLTGATRVLTVCALKSPDHF